MHTIKIFSQTTSHRNLVVQAFIGAELAEGAEILAFIEAELAEGTEILAFIEAELA